MKLRVPISIFLDIETDDPEAARRLLLSYAAYAISGSSHNRGFSEASKQIMDGKVPNIRRAAIRVEYMDVKEVEDDDDPFSDDGYEPYQMPPFGRN